MRLYINQAGYLPGSIKTVILAEEVHISVNRRADSADIGVTFPEPSAYNSAQTACFY